MRKELEQLELIDQYLDGKLSEEDKIQFEKRLSLESDLKQALNDQIALRKGIERLAWKKEMKGNRSGGGNTWKLLTVGIIVILVSSLYFILNNSELEGRVSETSFVEPIKEVVSVEDTCFSAKKETIQMDYIMESIAEAKVELVEEKLIKKAVIQKAKAFDVKTQKFILDNSKENIITGSGGTVIVFPKNAFDTEGKVELRLKEYLKPSDIVMSGLSTVSDGQFIETGGMIDIRAFSGGKNVDLREGVVYEIRFPKQSKRSFAYKSFYAHKEDSVLNWKLDSNYIYNSISRNTTMRVGQSLIEVKGPLIKADGIDYAIAYMGAYRFTKEDREYLTKQARRGGTQGYRFGLIAIEFEVEKGEPKSISISGDTYFQRVLKKYFEKIDKTLLKMENLTYSGKLWFDEITGSFAYQNYDISQRQLQLEDYTKLIENNKERRQRREVREGAFQEVMNSIYGNKLGLVNCDAFANFTGKKISVQAKSDFEGSAMLIVKYRNIYLSPTLSSNTLYQFYNIPEKMPVALVIFEKMNDDYYKVAIQEFKAGRELIELKSKNMTHEELAQAINKIKSTSK